MTRHPLGPRRSWLPRARSGGLLRAAGAPTSTGSDVAAPPMLLDGLGRHHQAVTTTSREAQAYFDQGLRLVYAFNHIEASARSARRPGSIPTCAMCYWGIALTHGSNYNSPTDAEREKAAYAAIQQARARWPAGSRRASARPSRRSRSGTRPRPAPTGPALDRAYADAMREVAQRFPDDLDAATLFADALMNLRPWNLWKPDGSMQPETPEILATLERVLAGEPGPSGREPPLHPRRRGRARPAARRGRAADRLRAAHARRRAHRPHAVAHLLARRPLRRRRRRERPRGQGRPRLLRQAAAEPDLPRTLLPAQHRLHLAVGQHGGPERGHDPRGARVRGRRRRPRCSARCRTWRPRRRRRSSRWRASGAGRRSCASPRRRRSSRT